MCERCAAERKAARNRRNYRKDAEQKVVERRMAAVEDLVRRGPGRPPLDPGGGDTVPLTIRITEAHHARLRELMTREGIRDLAGAVRWAIDHTR